MSCILVGFMATLLAQANEANKCQSPKTDRKQVAGLPRKEKRRTLPDPEQPGLYLRIPPAFVAGPIAFVAVARDPGGKQIWTTVGTADALGIDQARELAQGDH